MPISSSRSSNFYRKILSAGIDSPIAGLTANDSTKKIFSTMTPNGICCNGDSSTDPVNPVFTRSTTCWAKNIDTSPISPWNNGGGYPAPEHAGGFGGTGTLISPRHIVYCNHFQIKVGKKLIFVDMNNTCYIRTITNSLQIGVTDIRIGLLDSDLPSSVSFCKVASFDLTTITDTNNRVAALYLDQERKALVGDYFNFSNSIGSLNISTNSQRANFYELPIGGDSACPINFVYNNKIILLFLFTATTGGASIPYNIAEINSVMTTLGGGYTLSLFNKNDIISQEKNISIKKQNLGGGKISLYKAPPIFITFGQSLVVNNFQSDPDANCSFSFLNRTWIYLGAPSFRYRPIDNLSYHITTPLTPNGYGGNGSYDIRGSDDVFFTNSYNNSDKFPSNNWQLASYINNTCPQITTTPIFSLL